LREKPAAATGNKTLSRRVFVVGERKMNIPASHNDGYLVNWLAAVLLLIGFGLGDATIVAWSASVITFWQLVAVTSSFGLIAMGILITFWQMRRGEEGQRPAAYRASRYGIERDQRRWIANGKSQERTVQSARDH
jgi:hypothetical protein